ncbi:hypothetical protein [Clostridium sp. D53t1_180928_C8]|uniref:hypothetical protein n=1 Tax=Clostridium sp. D53t1_180928_C8 TaxID=2787101 RepID=UPI0018AA69DB|nr:hypothetical protein [Clostridium sp. D53t1_180928_C8]
MGRKGYKIGDVIGNFTVTDIDKSKERIIYTCKCICGNERLYTSLQILRNKSCGCMRVKSDLIGKQFGKLTVLNFIERKGRHSYFKCICECGNEKTATRQDLISNNTRSCGCSREDNIKKVSKLNKIEGTNVGYLKSSKLSKANKSGCRGVCQISDGRWQAQIMFKGKNYKLGRFKEKDDAIKARKEAEEKLHKEFLRRLDKRHSR